MGSTSRSRTTARPRSGGSAAPRCRTCWSRILRLPHADGLAVARYGRSRKVGLPVIVVTGYPNRIARSDLDPSAAVLTKPLDYPALSEELRRALAVEPRAVAH